MFSTENDPGKYPNGWYEHGKFPFVFDSLFDIEGSPCGYSYTDICKDTQIQIDELSDAIIQNALMGSKRRYFIKGNGSVNEEEFADWNNDFVHVYNGNLGEDGLREINVSNLGGVYLNVLESKINELKETSGNQDVSNGTTSSSVTAASAIAALQEAAGKTSRDFMKTTYNAYEEIITLVIELARKDFVEQKISENGTMMQMLAQYQQVALQLASMYAPELVPQLEAMTQGQGAGVQNIESADMSSANTDLLGGYKAKEHSRVSNARAQAAASTQVT